MSSKVAQKERTHASILASACQLLREKGIGGARVADVMQGAGLTVGGFYAHFASKDALVDAVLRKTAAFMRSRMFDRIEEKPLAARGEVVLKRYLSAAHRDDAKTGCPFPAVAGEVATTTPEHASVLAEQLDVLVTELTTHLTGDARRTTAIGMVALMFGGITLARAVRGTEFSDEILRACRTYGGHRSGRGER